MVAEGKRRSRESFLCYFLILKMPEHGMTITLTKVIRNEGRLQDLFILLQYFFGVGVFNEAW